MTRINLIPVEELTDQHLLAEHREIKRIPNLIFSWKYNDKWTPEKFTLWTWHVKFFYFRLYFLYERYLKLYNECIIRWFNVENYSKSFDWPLVFFDRMNNWKPAEKDIELSRQRIEEKIKAKPDFYKYYWKNSF